MTKSRFGWWISAAYGRLGIHDTVISGAFYTKRLPRKVRVGVRMRARTRDGQPVRSAELCVRGMHASPRLAHAIKYRCPTGAPGRLVCRVRVDGVSANRHPDKFVGVYRTVLFAVPAQALLDVLYTRRMEKDVRRIFEERGYDFSAESLTARPTSGKKVAAAKRTKGKKR